MVVVVYQGNPISVTNLRYLVREISHTPHTGMNQVHQALDHGYGPENSSSHPERVSIHKYVYISTKKYHIHPLLSYPVLHSSGLETWFRQQVAHSSIVCLNCILLNVFDSQCVRSWRDTEKAPVEPWWKLQTVLSYDDQPFVTKMTWGENMTDSETFRDTTGLTTKMKSPTCRYVTQKRNSGGENKQ